MIYLDNAATTLMYPEVRDTVSYYEKYFYKWVKLTELGKTIPQRHDYYISQGCYRD